ncbi:MAG: SDR family NAD(P)-dependent oxidoreductase [Burkholderiales bacterium]|nr:SDR family NAD(P)-dependent oxidoreductase [Burkholderiales bacterium]
MSDTHLYILTGASRGMGLAMAQLLLAPGHSLLCISRQANAGLTAQAAQAGCTLEQWPLDLAHSREAAAMLRQWLGKPGPRPASATLINNAGMIPRITPLSDIDPDDLARTLRVDLEAPMALSAAFLAATGGWGVPRRILNISSGLGRRPMASQAVYCAAKAGMDHYTRCLALEEARKPQGAQVCSLAPGVVDTDMQLQLRGADAAAFPDRARFEQLKSGGQLDSPDAAARKVLAYLDRPDFGSEPVADVRG